ncbi:response regulator transcription factor [Pseudomonas sp. RL_15y_Pfl2_60]|uniref:response regulator transcription factor n=1 Tax=Pseudomonas sp. RL_15y_Pfl2_60 TaxID=3088709 RepID=UPI0030D7BF1D
MRKILIVDDHPVIRLAVRVLLEQEGYEIVGEADNGVDALQLTKDKNPDVVILDIGIPRLDGLQVISRLKATGGLTRVLVLTSQPASTLANRCMQVGAAGFVSKDQDLAGLCSAVNAILSGYTYFPYGIFGSTHDSEQPESQLLESLSDRELMVLQYLAKGMTNKQIADIMLLSNKTVSTYKTRLLQKLGATSLVELLEFAKRNNVA